MSPFASGVLASVILATIAGVSFVFSIILTMPFVDYDKWSMPSVIALFFGAVFASLAEIVLLLDIFNTFGWPR